MRAAFVLLAIGLAALAPPPIGGRLPDLKAREKVPEKWREASLFDSDGAMAKALGIEGGKVPWVFAVGRQGEVLAGAHGGVDARDAAAIWRALQISTPPRKSEAAPR